MGKNQKVIRQGMDNGKKGERKVGKTKVETVEQGRDAGLHG